MVNWPFSGKSGVAEALLDIMLLMAISDDETPDDELATILEIVLTQPEFAKFPKNELESYMSARFEVITKDRPRALMDARSTIKSKAHKIRALELARVVLVADGIADPKEERMWRTMRDQLGVSAEEAQSLESQLQAPSRDEVRRQQMMQTQSQLPQEPASQYSGVSVDRLDELSDILGMDEGPAGRVGPESDLLDSLMAANEDPDADANLGELGSSPAAAASLDAPPPPPASPVRATRIPTLELPPPTPAAALFGEHAADEDDLFLSMLDDPEPSSNPPPPPPSTPVAPPPPPARPTPSIEQPLARPPPDPSFDLLNETLGNVPQPVDPLEAFMQEKEALPPDPTSSPFLAVPSIESSFDELADDAAALDSLSKRLRSSSLGSMLDDDDF